MKNLRKFDTIEAYNKSKKEYPQVTLVAEDNSVHYGEEIKPTKEYMIPFRINPDSRYFKDVLQFAWVFIRYDVKVYSKADPAVLVESYERTEQIAPDGINLYAEWLLPAKADMLYDVKITYLDDSFSNNPDRLHNTIKIPNLANVAESGPSVGQGGFNGAIQYTHDDFYMDIVGIDPELMEIPDSYFVMELRNYQTMLVNFDWSTSDQTIIGNTVGEMRESSTDGNGNITNIIGGVSSAFFRLLVDPISTVGMTNVNLSFFNEYAKLIQFQDTKDPFIKDYSKHFIETINLFPNPSIIVKPEHYEYTAKIEDYVEAKLPVYLGINTTGKKPIDWITFDIKLDCYAKTNPDILVDSKSDEYEFVPDASGISNILELMLDADSLYDMTVTYNTDSQSINFAGNILDIGSAANNYPFSVLENFSSTGFKITGIDAVKYGWEISPAPTYINMLEVSHLQINRVGVNGVIPDKENLIVRTIIPNSGQTEEHKFLLSDNTSFWINQKNFVDFVVPHQVELILEHHDPNNPIMQFRGVDFGGMTDINILDQQKDRILLEYITSDPNQRVIELSFEPYQQEIPDITFQLNTNYPNLKPEYIEYRLYTGNYGYGDELLRTNGFFEGDGSNIIGRIDSATFSNEQGELPVFIELTIKNPVYQFDYTPEMPSGDVTESNKYIFPVDISITLPTTIYLDIIEVPALEVILDFGTTSNGIDTSLFEYEISRGLKKITGDFYNAITLGNNRYLLTIPNMADTIGRNTIRITYSGKDFHLSNGAGTTGVIVNNISPEDLIEYLTELDWKPTMQIVVQMTDIRPDATTLELEVRKVTSGDSMRQYKGNLKYSLYGILNGTEYVRTGDFYNATELGNSHYLRTVRGIPKDFDLLYGKFWFGYVGFKITAASSSTDGITILPVAQDKDTRNINFLIQNDTTLATPITDKIEIDFYNMVLSPDEKEFPNSMKFQFINSKTPENPGNIHGKLINSDTLEVIQTFYNSTWPAIGMDYNVALIRYIDYTDATFQPLNMHFEIMYDDTSSHTFDYDRMSFAEKITDKHCKIPCIETVKYRAIYVIA